MFLGVRNGISLHLGSKSHVMNKQIAHDDVYTQVTFNYLDEHLVRHISIQASKLFLIKETLNLTNSNTAK